MQLGKGNHAYVAGKPGDVLKKYSGLVNRAIWYGIAVIMSSLGAINITGSSFVLL